MVNANYIAGSLCHHRTRICIQRSSRKYEISIASVLVFGWSGREYNNHFSDETRIWLSSSMWLKTKIKTPKCVHIIFLIICHISGDTIFLLRYLSIFGDHIVLLFDKTTRKAERKRHKIQWWADSLWNSNAKWQNTKPIIVVKYVVM